MRIHPDPDGWHRRRRNEQRRPAARAARGRRGRRARRWLLVAALLVAAAGTVPVVAVRFVDPPRTAFMLATGLTALREDHETLHLDYRWRDLAAISPWMGLAVIAAEDQKFPTHNGFDVEAIGEALEAHRAGARLRGASTLSQQLAKNLFLWSGRSWLRKGLEAWYTFALEAVVPKRRLLELYLNVAEFGHGVYGVEAAAQRYFGTAATGLDPSRAALLATVLPAPRTRSVLAPDAGMRARQQWIVRQMRQLGGLAYLDRLR